MFYAHTAEGAPWQSLREHLLGTAFLAEARAAKFGAGKAGRLGGLLHDLGKYTLEFLSKLNGAKLRVDHSTAGARIIDELVAGGSDHGMAELIAYGIAGHHAGLPDKTGGDRSLSTRIRNDATSPDPVWREELIIDAKGLMPSGFRWHPENARRPFQLAMLGRMLFSCLVDADFRDTESFYHKVEGKEVDRDWPALASMVDRLIAKFDVHMSTKVAARAGGDPGVYALRADILSHARRLAGTKPGVFTFTVPTGGGKTLASLAFALEHARANKLDRIIYAIPFTSIIDQTASIFGEVLGKDIVLEHHSAIDEERLRSREGAEKLKLAMEDWAAPVVVTTNVQLFESLFANRPSRCRKLHNLARSVIVLDEAQTIPRHVLLPCVAALDELSRNYGASIVLCTATQPALLAKEDRFKGGFEDVRELAPDPRKLHDALKRVTLRHAGEMSDEDLVAALGGAEQGLVIVNTRKHALALYLAAREAGLDGLVHLTTRQYAAHRRAVLAEVRERLKAGKLCRVISSSLIECGVDVDLPRIWRAEAGLEQIWQAAGRCNREGLRDREDSVVTVFRSLDNPPPPELKQLANAVQPIQSRHPDLMSLEALHDYFQEVYWRKGAEGLDRINVPDLDGVDRPRKVMELFNADAKGTDFAYRSVAEGFSLIESGMAPVIVARDEEARKALSKLRNNPHVSAGSIQRLLQPYIVQVPPKARNRLIACGHVSFEASERFGDQFAVLRAPSLYRGGTGLWWEDAEYLQIEGSMI